MEAMIPFGLVIILVIGVFVWKEYTKKKDHDKRMKDYKDFKDNKIKWRKYIGDITSLSAANKATEFINSGDIKETDKKTIINEIVFEAIEEMLNDNYLSNEEENALASFMNQFDKNTWDRHLLEKIEQARIIKALADDKEIPDNSYYDTTIILNKNESLIYVFEDIKFAQERIKTSYTGTSKGISVRVAKGVYLRGGGFKGQAVKTSEIQLIDTGDLTITSQNIYFKGQNKSIKIELKKVMNLEAYSNGIKVEKDGVSFKPYYFLDVDTWFAGNLITILAGKLR